MRDLLAPYLDAVAALNRGGLKRLSGLARAGAGLAAAAGPAHRLRARACGRAEALGQRMRGDRRIKAVAIDGYTALNAYVPPKERRGLVLIDPPFEQPDEFDRLAEALGEPTANGRPASICSGIRSRTRVRRRFARRLVRLGIARILRAELDAPAPRSEPARAAAGS